MKVVGLGQIPEIVVVEEFEFGAAWNGEHGYTNGMELLCTPPGMDVGYPYARTAAFGSVMFDRRRQSDAAVLSPLSRRIAQEIQRRFSWQAFLFEQSDEQASLARDIARRSPPPYHGLWARYLTWVFKEAAVCLGSDLFRKIKGCAVKIFPTGGSSVPTPIWTIHIAGPPPAVLTAKGVVLTGTGRAKPPPLAHGQRIEAPFLTDARSFWSHTEDFLELARNPGADLKIGVIGAGGAAATIICWLCEAFQTTEMGQFWSISPRAAFFPRGDGQAERQWAEIPERWVALPAQTRRAILERTDAGVISGRLKDRVERTTRIQYLPMRVKEIMRRGTISRIWPNLHVVGEHGDSDNEYTHLVDASGFDPWTLLDLAHDPGGTTRRLADALLAPGGKTIRNVFEESVSDHLDLPDLACLGGDFSGSWKGLHVPVLARMRGMGLANLGALGVMASLTLDPYLE